MPPEKRHRGEETEAKAEPTSVAEDEDPQPRPPPQPRRRKRFVLFGDSITQQSFAPGGWGARLADEYARKVKGKSGLAERERERV